ncbi:hypothetical protein ACGFIW_01700 [Micromonospora sp. NPDC048935]|uniref:hypothetical protein n=1 Tax=Micromonospora sp. NPDC048935 TaxID=3364262 RepID=UPI0037159282
MPLADGQVSVGGFLLGEGTVYSLQTFNPWTRTTRADQSGERAWGDGSWSGAEWAEQAVVPIVVLTQAETVDGWQAAHQALLAAFAPRSDDVEMRWRFGSTEYMMRGRPRMVEPEIGLIGLGMAMTRAAFVGLDSTVYSGVEHSVTLGLPSTSGGLTVPITVPFTIGAVVTSGRQTITNAGKKPTGLLLRVDGPVVEPRVSLLTSAGTGIVRVWVTLTAGQWLDIDTAARTVYINGTVSRRGLTSVEGIGWPVLPGGESAELAFDASSYDSSALLTARWRDAY